MNPFHLFLGRALKPFLYANLAAMLIAAVWLGMLGHFRVMWIGIVGLLFGPFLLFPILLLPAGVLAHFMALYQRTGDVVRENRFFVASIAYIVSFLSLWAAGVFWIVLLGLPDSAVTAGVLWAAGAALGPLWLWALRDRENYFIMTIVLSIQVAAIFLGFYKLMIGETGFWMAFLVIAAVSGVAVYVQNVLERKNP